MNKHKGILFTILFITILGSILALSYKSNKPQQVTYQASSAMMVDRSIEVNFDNLEKKLLQEDGTYFLWFCDQEDNDCQYVESKFIVPMLETLKVDSFENLHKVNFTNCPYSTAKLMERYNIDSTLAFVKVEVAAGVIEYTDSLTWTDDKNFTFEELKDWLYKHNIWQEAYTSSRKN